MSADTLSSLLEIWAEADHRRLKRRVIARKEEMPKVPKVKVSRQKLSLSERREREDERIKATHLKQDDMLAEKWRFEDIKRIAKRKAQGHLTYLRRCEQAVKRDERRREEDERHGLGLHDLHGLVRVDRLASGPGTKC